MTVMPPTFRFRLGHAGQQNEFGKSRKLELLPPSPAAAVAWCSTFTLPCEPASGSIRAGPDGVAQLRRLSTPFRQSLPR